MTENLCSKKISKLASKDVVGARSARCQSPLLADSTYWQHRNLRESYGSLLAYTGLSLSAGVYSWTRPIAVLRPEILMAAS